MDKIYNDAKTPIFSTRELEVADYISRGFSEKEIADKLHISRFTVKTIQDTFVLITDYPRTQK